MRYNIFLLFRIAYKGGRMENITGLQESLVKLCSGQLNLSDARCLLAAIEQTVAENEAIWPQLGISEDRIRQYIRALQIDMLMHHVANFRNHVYNQEAARDAYDIICAAVVDGIVLSELGLGSGQETPEKELARLLKEAEEARG